MWEKLIRSHSICSFNPDRSRNEISVSRMPHLFYWVMIQFSSQFIRSRLVIPVPLLTRDSFELDNVCRDSLVKKLLKKVFKRMVWVFDEQNLEYRPIMAFFECFRELVTNSMTRNRLGGKDRQNIWEWQVFERSPKQDDETPSSFSKNHFVSLPFISPDSIFHSENPK
jgi:hypothetical protein